jgi:uncharacterized phiE125 gp8 family phage protein
MIKVRVSQPTSEPITIADAKLWLPGADDAWLSAMIPMVREVVELWTSRVLAPSTWKVAFDADETAKVMRLPIRPVSAITSCEIYTPDGTQVSLSPVPQHRIASEYVLHWAHVEDITTHDLDSENALVLTVTAGYASPAEIPSLLRIAMREILAYWYQNRGEGFSLTGAVREAGVGSATVPPPVPIWVRQRLADMVHAC